jgi:hypothetical protein
LDWALGRTEKNSCSELSIASGFGAESVPDEAIERSQSQRIHELARRFAKLVKNARQQIEPWK